MMMAKSVQLVMMLVLVLINSQSSGVRAERDDTFFTDHLDRNVTGPPPIDLLLQMSCVTDYEDFLTFVDRSTLDPLHIDSRFGAGMDVERSSGILPKPATCRPEPTVVHLPEEQVNKDPNAIYFPSCTRVNRCSGCCSHPLLSCQATQTEDLTFQVIKSEWNGAGFAYKHKEPMVVVQHLKCQCGCAVREEHCNSFQTYNKGNCQCECQNHEERDKCLKQQDHLKLWDPATCTCRCRRPSECTTGSYFNENQCECLKVTR